MHEYTGTTVNPESGATMFTCACGDCFSKRDMALHLRVYSRDAVRAFIQAYKKVVHSHDAVRAFQAYKKVGL